MVVYSIQGSDTLHKTHQLKWPSLGVSSPSSSSVPSQQWQLLQRLLGVCSSVESEVGERLGLQLGS